MVYEPVRKTIKPGWLKKDFGLETKELLSKFCDYLISKSGVYLKSDPVESVNQFGTTADRILVYSPDSMVKGFIYHSLHTERGPKAEFSIELNVDDRVSKGFYDSLDEVVMHFKL